ncbi:hypothetical protein EMPS_08161 [Entomortierella parvispora]|uniref:Uncharacterized protein n=1 Tax=Entomortierella parvispora TaxID=205924 RepID=A0A9P3LZ48_9FUNG|nr:hypothetical protein EMPS_08161 [Entomortierella parvispora]
MAINDCRPNAVAGLFHRYQKCSMLLYFQLATWLPPIALLLFSPAVIYFSRTCNGISRTPKHLRPGPGLCSLSNESIPVLIFRGDFFKTVKPRWWTFEGYLDHGYLGIDDFVHDLRVIGTCTPRGPDHALMKKHRFRLLQYLRTDGGELLLRPIESNHIMKKETKSAI